MLRSDKLGVTSVIRDLALCPECYDSLLLLDRYFLTVLVLEKLESLNGSGDVRMEILF